ncbi:hypothetical protein BJ170DRAFT_629803 [Xylariales sp. AK1849]|nr:hypothetical protein BJ170DRAFT_629803 [Xylariales sp. AK1849]
MHVEYRPLSSQYISLPIMEPPSPRLTALLSCYPILSTLSSYISSLDLLQLTLVNRSCFSCILDAPLTFDTLRRRCLCDGHGIIGRRRDHDKTYYPSARRFRQNRVQSNGCVDEQIEIRLYVLKCDTADTLPCRKCDINVCEECRWHVGDRAGPIARLPDSRRPHLNGASQSENVMCLCPSCDEKVEDEVKGRFLHELCDCDTERRWICRKCEREESGFTSRYYVRHTVIEKDEEDTKVLADHGFRRSVCIIPRPRR